MMAKASDMWKTALATGVVVVAAIFGFAFMSGTATFSATDGIKTDTGGDDNTIDGIPANIFGDDANVDVVAKDAADSSNPDVEVPADLYSVSNGEEEDVNSADTNSDGTRQSISGLTVGENYAVYFGVDNATYYGDRVPTTGSELIDAKTVREDGEVYSIVGAGSASVKIYDTDDSSTGGGSVTVGSGETYSFEKIRARADAEDTAWNVEYVYINDTKLSGVDEWRLDGATEMDSVPDHLDSSVYSHAFKLDVSGDLTAGEEPTLTEFEKIEPGQLHLDMKSGQNPSGEIGVCVDDDALYKDSEDGDRVKQGVEDEDDNSLGLAEQCVYVTVN